VGGIEDAEPLTSPEPGPIRVGLLLAVTLVTAFLGFAGYWVWSSLRNTTTPVLPVRTEASLGSVISEEGAIRSPVLDPNLSAPVAKAPVEEKRPTSAPSAPKTPVAATPAPTPAPAAVPASTGTGFLTVSATPRAQVIVDGQPGGWVPQFRLSLSAGSHTITLVTEDGRRQNFRVDIKAGAETRRIWDFEKGAWAEK